MNRAKFCPGRTHRLRRWLLCLATLWVLIDAPFVAAQDLKTLSATLASRIGSSGRRAIAVVDFTDLRGNVTELGRYLGEATRSYPLIFSATRRASRS